MKLILFQRDDCPLCDTAYEVLAAAGLPDFEAVWIDGDERLEARYGQRIPVLRCEGSGREIDWPFDVGQIRALIA